ncbi:MAG: hypothetical protein V4573_04090 [Pseudomonadota bacterium]
MTRIPRIPQCFSWDQCRAAADGPALAYGASEAVREWLVLLALSGSPLEKPAELERATAMAFANVCHDVRQGLVLMDYQPFDPKTLDIPPIDHPEHMQALLYWSCTLGCTLSGLAEAHAQLGSHPRLDDVRAAMLRMSHEDAQGRTQAASTQRPADVATTMAMFADTYSGIRLAGGLA